MERGFSEQEQTVRKWWLRVFICQTIFSFISYSYHLLDSMPTLWESTTSLMTLIFAIGALVSGWGYWIYYSAYKKRGTRILTFLIALAWVLFIVVGIKTLITTVFLLMEKGGPSFTLPSASVMGGYLLTVTGWIIGFPYYLLNVRLRKVNRLHQKIQSQIAESIQ